MRVAHGRSRASDQSADSRIRAALTFAGLCIDLKATIESSGITQAIQANKQEQEGVAK